MLLREVLRMRLGGGGCLERIRWGRSQRVELLLLLLELLLILLICGERIRMLRSITQFQSGHRRQAAGELLQKMLRILLKVLYRDGRGPRGRVFFTQRWHDRNERVLIG